MSTGIWAAASGAVAQAASLDVAANNVSNALTPGFRSEQEVFRRTLAQAVGGNASQSAQYAVVRTVQPDFQLGQVVQTGNPLDVSFTDEKGLFVVATPQGERYTRAGKLSLRQDGTLINQAGQPYLGPNRRPVQINPSAGDVRIDSQGRILADGEEAGKLLIVAFQDPSVLQAEGSQLLRARPGSAPPAVHEAQLQAESLELSNSDAVKSMTGIVEGSRQFEMLTRVIDAFSNIDRQAAGDIMKG